MATHTTLTELFTNIADEIRAKKGSTETIVADNFPTEIANLPSSGGTQMPEHGVFFIDYDGSIVEAWESSSVASKTSLPNNPTHTGLVSQGWNWTLSDIKTYIQDYPEACFDVGQLYATTSGLTEIDITLTKAIGLEITCNMVGNKNWGDGTTDNLTTHTYTNYGDYTITCDGTNIPSGASSSNGMFGDSYNYFCTHIKLSSNVKKINSYSFSNCYSLKSITIPNNITLINTYAFKNCRSLQSITIPNTIEEIYSHSFDGNDLLQHIAIPNSITEIQSFAFAHCYNLKYMSIPNGVTQIPYQGFEYCYSLQNITIPNTVTEFGSQCFYYCYSLKNITTMPSGLTRILNDVFNYCYPIMKYDFSLVNSVPNLTNTNAFSTLSRLCKIIVPSELYWDWIEATNWANYAGCIYPDGIPPLLSIGIKENNINIYSSRQIYLTPLYNGVITPFEGQEGYILNINSGKATLNGNILILNDDAAAGDVINITITSTYDSSISSTKDIEVIYQEPTYSVDLNNGEWIDSETTIDGHIVYKSDGGSYNINNGKSTATITVSGFTNFTLYIRSFAESTYDYTEAFAENTTASRGNGLYTTKGHQSATNYIKCDYVLDGGTNTIQIMYSKDSSGNNDDDRGYFYIEGGN